MGLQREIVGDLLDTADLDQVRAAGAILAQLQDALAAYPDADRLPALAVASKPLTARVTDWLDSRAGHLPMAARDTLRGLVASAPPDRLPRQLVHFDFRSANILCARGEVAAIIDFEEAQHEHRLVELARAAVLLGTRYHNWGPVSAEVRAEFLTGYESERPLTPAEAGWLDILLLWQGLAMVPPGDDPTGWGPSVLSQLTRP
jgi:homoserine kinase type II